MTELSFRRPALRSLLCVVLGVSTAAIAAPRNEPPLHVLGSNVFTVVCARALTTEVPNELKLDLVSTVRGQPRRDQRVRVPEGLHMQLDPERPQLFVYIDVHRDPRKPDQYEVLPQGTIVSIEGAEPAVFGDCERTTPWFSPEQLVLERSPDYRAVVMAGLGSADRHEQNLWVAELLYRPSLRDSLDNAERQAVFALASDPDTVPSARARLLAAAIDGSLAVPAAQLRSAVESVLADTQVEQSPGLRNPEQPVFEALRFVTVHPEGVDAAILKRWLRSPRPALAEQAALALRALDPELEAPAVETALADTLMPAATRAFMRDHLRRLRAMPSAAGR